MDSEVLKLILEFETKGMASVRKELLKLVKEFESEFGKVLSSAFDVERDVADSMENAMKRSSKGVAKELKGSILDAWQGAGKGISTTLTKSIDSAIAGLQSPKAAGKAIAEGFFKGIGKSGSKLSDMMSSKGKSKMSKGDKITGGLLRTMGPMLKIVSTLVGSLGSMIALLLDAEAQAKDLNKALLDGGVAGGDLVQNFGEAYGALEVLRTAAVNFTNNMAWGTVAKDQLEIIGAYNEAGFTLKEMTRGTKNATEAMMAYQDVTRVALTYSKLLGMSTREIATMQAGYMESMGASLGHIESQFNAIYKTAQLSGFGVKRFTGMVQQATSGMALYNVRISEAAGLLQTLGDALSPEEAGKFIGTLNQGFANEGMTDRIKRILTTGSGEMKKIFERSADDIAKEFGANVAKSGSQTVQNEFAALGLDVNFETEEGRSEVIKTLRGLDPKEQARMLSRVRATDPELARSLGKFMDISEGTSGSMDDMARNMHSLDMGGVLAANLSQMQEVIGKPLHEMNYKELAQFESGTGVSGEQLTLLTKVSETLEGNFAELQSLSVAGMSQEERMAEQIRQMEAYGAAIDENGKMFIANLSQDGTKWEGTQDIENMGEYIQSSGDMIAAATEVGLDKNTAIAQEIARNTTEVSRLLEIGVQYWLEEIYQMVAPLVSYLLGGKDPAEVKQELEFLDTLSKKTTGERMDLEKQLSGLRVDLDTASGDEKKDVEAKIAAVQEAIDQNMLKDSMVKAQRESVEKSLFDADAETDLYSAGNFRTAVSSSMGEEKLAEIEAAVRQNVERSMKDMGIEEVHNLARGTSNVDDTVNAALKEMSRGLSEGKTLDELVTSATSTNLIPGHLKEGVPELTEPQAIANEHFKFFDLDMRDPKLLAQLEANQAQEANSQRRRGRLVGEGREAGKAFIAHSSAEGASVPSEWAEFFGLTQDQIDILDKLQQNGLTDEAFRNLSNKELEQLTLLNLLLPDASVREREAKKYAEMVAKEMTRAQLIQKGISQISSWNPKEFQKEYSEMMRNVDAATSGDAEALRKLSGGSGSVAQDFIYRPGSPPMKFSDQDTVVGFKKGGAFDRSKNPNVTINVYGSQGEIVSTIKRVFNQYGFNT